MRNLRKSELQTGDAAPDFTLPTVDGQPISLSSTLRGRSKVLLVFLRHLG
jgi:peroxiredoxin